MDMSRSNRNADPASLRAGIYARKSNEDAKRPGKSVNDQIREARAEITMRGYSLDPSNVYADDGISASRHSKAKARPGFAALVAAIDARELDVVVMAEQSRLSRKQSQLWTVVEMCQEAGIRLVIGGRDVDPSNPNEIVLLSVQGGMDAAESDRTRVRVLRGMRQAAVDGRPAGRNMYGYVRKYDSGSGALQAVVEEPTEAAIVREIVRRVLAGDSLRQIATDLNKRGVPSPYDEVAKRTGREDKVRGSSWVGTQVRRIAISPAYAGKRIHLGQLSDAIWPPLISMADHERAVALITNPARRTNAAVRPGAILHWLSGIAKCGECGAGLRCQVNRGKYRHYLCPKCFKVSRTAFVEPDPKDPSRMGLENYVQMYVFEIARRPDVLAAIAAANSTGSQASDAVARLDELTARRENFRAAMVSGALPAEDGMALLLAIATEIDAAALAVKSMAVPRNIADVISDDLEDHWEDYSPARKREIADALLDITVLSLNGQKSRTFRPESVRVRPKGMDAAMALGDDEEVAS